tara:strand:- start:389 stop:652 length:264 start_codon:yes stop_codon:yes gene_type:complete
MPKPNQNMTVEQMKSYVRSHNLNHPDVKLGMRRAQLISGLKKAGHWDEVPKKPRGKVITLKSKPDKAEIRRMMREGYKFDGKSFRKS